MGEHWSPKPNAKGSNPFFPVGVWPSGKALVFGTSIDGSIPSTPELLDLFGKYNSAG
jgi:hypothetical protein